MQYKTIKVFSYTMIAILLASCFDKKDVPDFDDGEYRGFKPIYVSKEEAAIVRLPSRPLESPGKIYVYGHYLLISETHKGIHFFDNTDPEAPKPLAYLRIYGNVDMAIKNNVLYVDHVGDLVALDMTDIENIKEISRLPLNTNAFPQQTGYYFECADPSKGSVIGWEMSTIKNPKCYR
jgi:hypothetical protein